MTSPTIDSQPVDDPAVSPIVGVVLLVAVTVILAAVIGTFALEMNKYAGQYGPNVALSAELDPGENNVTIQHKGGDSLHRIRSKIVVRNDSAVMTYTSSKPVAFQVGSFAEFSVNSTAVDGWGGNTQWSQSGSFELESGETYTVQIIDIESSTVVYEGEVEATPEG